MGKFSQRGRLGTWKDILRNSRDFCYIFRMNDFNHLSEEERRVLREKGTEMPFSGEYNKFYEDGAYHCKACGNLLFKSDTKFDSGSGWPSFWQAAEAGSVEYHEDSSHGMRRTEVTCKNCGSHLGHVFPDGPADKTGQRYCINSVCLNFKRDS